MIPELPKKVIDRPPIGRMSLFAIFSFTAGVITTVFVALVLYRFYQPTPAIVSNLDDFTVSQGSLPGSEPDLEDDGEQEGALQVNWLDTPVSVEASSLGITLPSDAIDRYGTDELNAIYTVTAIGTVVTAPFGGKTLYLIERDCESTCAGVHYRVIDDRGGKGLVLLAHFSNAVFEEDEAYFFRTIEYDIPELRLPEILTVMRDGQRFFLEAEPFSPAVRGATYRPDPEGTYLDNLQHESLSVVEHKETGLYYVTLPDLTLKVYRPKDPFNLQESSYGSPALLTRAFTLAVPEALVREDTGRVRNIYSPSDPFGACPPRRYNVVDNMDTLVTPLSPDEASDEQLYLLSDPNDPRYWAAFTQIDSPNLSFPEYLNSYPLLYWKNPLGRWIEFRRADTFPTNRASCGYINSAL